MYYFSNRFRYGRFVFLIGLLFSIFTFPLLAFEDNFTSDPVSNPNWSIQNPVGLTFDNPGITLTSNGQSFPYLKTSIVNDLSMNKYHEIKFQYLSSSSPWGVGASFTDNAPNFPTYFGLVEDYLKYNIAYFFGNKLHSVITLCPAESSTCPNNWWFIYPNNPPTNAYLNSTTPDFNVHTFTVIRSNFSDSTYIYKIFLDSNFLVETKPTTRLINSMWIGHPSTLDSPKSWPILRVISVRSLSEIPGSFPHLSQKSEPWGDDEYDNAGQWAGVAGSGIDRWGCALTSAAMILQKYGVKDLDSNEMKPDWLNEWLKAEPDGYIGPGYINWLAIARYARGKATEGKSLEYTRSYDVSAMELPAILGLSGHFVVAHDEDVTNWKINDPNLSDGNSDLSKTTSIRSINKYTLSSTDLSYMLFAAGAGVTASVSDDSDSTIPLTWLEESLSDDLGGSVAIPSLFTTMIPKPASGVYRLKIDNSTPTTEAFKLYLYGQDGQVKAEELTVEPGEQLYEITFSKTTIGESKVEVVDTTAPTLSVKTNFTGWYNIAQTAYFTYSDDNLRDDYRDPSCVIGTEGKNQTCTIYPNICDKAGNCNTTPQTSNSANIDRTPPKPPKIVWASDYWQRILAVWSEVRDSEKYNIYVGPKTSELSKVGETKEPYWISLFLKPGKYYVAITGVDKAGNESPKSKVIRVNVINRWGGWR